VTNLQGKQPVTQIAAHRGGAGLWPENSMTAFENAARLDVDLVEFDVHPTLDGRLVVHHDPTLERMTNGNGPLVEKPYDELAGLTIRGTDNGRIPLLSEVIAVFRSTSIDFRIEIKADVNLVPYRGLEDKVARKIEVNNILHRTVITSFFINTLERFCAVATPHNMIWLVKATVFQQIGGIDSILSIAKKKGIAEIALHESVVDQPAVREAGKRGIRLGAFAVNDEPAIRRMLDLGVSTFTTDRPDLALKIRGQLR